MELQKGICFLCYNASIIKDFQSQKISDLITFLLPKEINSTEVSCVIYNNPAVNLVIITVYSNSSSFEVMPHLLP